MEIQKDLAIVLKSILYEEKHKIITALTQNHGIVSALAKNSVQSRRFGGSLDLFSASEWLFRIKPNSNLLQLTEAQLRYPFEGLRQNFEKLTLASAFNEFLLKVAVQDEPCPELFQLHSNALFALDHLNHQGTEFPFLNAYLAKLLQWSGNQPLLQKCLQCELPLESFAPQIELSCLVADAGWVCPTCRHQYTRHIQDEGAQGIEKSLLRATSRVIQDFQMSLQTPIRQILKKIQAPKDEHRALFAWLEALYIYHIPSFDQKPMKTLRFLKNL